VFLDVVYKNRTFKECFYVIEDNKEETILLSNSFVKRTERNCELPIKCNINTKGSAPISWNRPIRNLHDKIEFQKMVDELEKKRIVEESTSMWLNPVVLVRKKSDTLRFCIDFRKLNDMVEPDHYEIPRINELLSLLNKNNT
jgi:hypothetical protein